MTIEKSNRPERLINKASFAKKKKKKVTNNQTISFVNWFSDTVFFN